MLTSYSGSGMLPVGRACASSLMILPTGDRLIRPVCRARDRLACFLLRSSWPGLCRASFVPVVCVSSTDVACSFPCLSCHPCLPCLLLSNTYDLKSGIAARSIIVIAENQRYHNCSKEKSLQPHPDVKDFWPELASHKQPAARSVVGNTIHYGMQRLRGKRRHARFQFRQIDPGGDLTGIQLNNCDS